MKAHEIGELFKSGKTLVTPDRLDMIDILISDIKIKKLEGSVAEVGVYKGGTAKLICEGFKETNKDIFLFDTFTGLPKEDKEKDNAHKEGDFNDTSYHEVTNYLKEYNVFVYKGKFPDTVTPINKEKFCFVHIDVDIYPSIIDCCNFFYPRMVEGGIILFDDYGFDSCKGAKIGVDEFFENKIEPIKLLTTKQALVIKEK